MATGIQNSDSKQTVTIRLVEGATATTSTPTGAPSATPASGTGFDLRKLEWGGLLPDSAEIHVYSTAGSGVMDVTARVWNYALSGAVWAPLGTGAAATKGILNNGAAIGETGSDTIRHSEPLAYIANLDGIAVTIDGINGTDTAINVDLVFSRVGRR